MEGISFVTFFLLCYNRKISPTPDVHDIYLFPYRNIYGINTPSVKWQRQCQWQGPTGIHCDA